MLRRGYIAAIAALVLFAGPAAAATKAIKFGKLVDG